MKSRLSKDERERLKKEHERALSENKGSVLGLGRDIEPTADDTIHATDDPEEVARRRTRALGEDEADRPSETATQGLRPSTGATGIDMGYGGQGTDLKGPSTRKKQP